MSEKDTVQVVGVRADGTQEVIGTAPTPPKMKARELVREMFGGFTPGDGSEADMALDCCDLLLEYIGKTQFSIAPARVTFALQIPTGYVLVPAEATRAMCEAAPSLPAVHAVHDLPLGRAGWVMPAIQNLKRWRAMVAAAPVVLPPAPAADGSEETRL